METTVPALVLAWKAVNPDPRADPDVPVWAVDIEADGASRQIMWVSGIDANDLGTAYSWASREVHLATGRFLVGYHPDGSRRAVLELGERGLSELEAINRARHGSEQRE